MEKHRTTVITISRQMASGGSFVARKVAKRLGFRFMDRDILRKAAEALGSDEDDLADREERLSTFFENYVRTFAAGTPETGYVPLPKRPVFDRDLFNAQAEIITDVASRHDAVIVGRAAFHILRDYPGLISVLLHAPMDSRVKRLMKARHLHDIDQARSQIEESDKRRKKFIQDMTEVNWMDARNYHLCFDTSVTGLNLVEETICSLAAFRGQYT